MSSTQDRPDARAEPSWLDRLLPHVEGLVDRLLGSTGTEDLFQRLWRQSASTNLAHQWKSDHSVGTHHHTTIKLWVLPDRDFKTVAGPYRGLREGARQKAAE
jgi:hypothetical protein